MVGVSACTASVRRPISSRRSADGRAARSTPPLSLATLQRKPTPCRWERNGRAGRWTCLRNSWMRARSSQRGLVRLASRTLPGRRRASAPVIAKKAPVRSAGQRRQLFVRVA
jgi:hypothetical protein